MHTYTRMWDDFFLLFAIFLDFYFRFRSRFAKIFVGMDLFERHGTEPERGQII